MSDYKPDKWVLVKITSTETNQSHYRVFACWYGGYLGADSWKMNSGITKATESQDHYLFEGSSGSIYSCVKGCYGTSGYGHGVLSGLIEKGAKDGLIIEMLDESVNPMELEYA